MKKKSFFVSLVIILTLLVYPFFTVSIFAQEYINKFNHISTSDRFSLNSVIAIKQDKWGMMWFGTRKGLVRFDGLELKFVQKNGDKKSSSKYNDINDIFIDKAGNIWLATNEGLCIYDPKKDVVKIFESEGQSKLLLSSKVITCVREMTNGEIWIGTKKGLNIYNPKNNSLKYVFFKPAQKKSISSNNINCIYQKKDGSIWIGTNNGLNKYLSSTNGVYQFETFKHSNSNKNSIVNDEVNVLLEDKNQNLWVGTQDGLDYLNVKNDNFIHLNKDQNNPIAHKIIRAMTIDQKGRLWVGSFDGITIIDSFKVAYTIKHEPDLPFSLVDNKIRILFTDKHGSVWVGSYYGGINYWNDKQLNFLKIDEGNGRKLSSKVVSSIVQASNEKIYFGTEGEGISVLNLKSDTYEYIKRLNDNTEIGSVKTLFLGDKEDLWIGTFNNGLIYYNIKTKESKIYKNKYKDESSLSSNKVLSIANSGSEHLWIGTLDNGLNLFNIAKGSFVRIKSNPKDSNLTNLHTVRKLLVDVKEDLYIGTTKGLFLLPGNKYSEAMKIIKISFAEQPEETIDVMDVFQDKQGRIWVATIDKGLLLLKKGKLHHVKIDYATTVYSILQDVRGVLWLSSSEGMIRYNPVKGESKLFNFNDGVPSNEFLRISKLYSKRGRIYFGGASGVTTFKPDDLSNINKFAPSIVITGFKLFDKLLKPGDSTEILNHAIEETNSINLDYTQNTFTINFSMPNYIKSGKNSYQYRLKGLEDKWTTTSNPTVYYTIQQGGTYLFEVKGTNGDGYPTLKTTSLEIVVSSAPWKTWWAYSFYTIVVIGAFILYVYFFQSKLQLQHKLEVEKRELVNQHALHQQKLQFFTNISHEFRTPLTLISGLVQKLIEDYKGPHKFFSQVLVINKHTAQLTKLINELLDFRKFEDRQMKLQAAEGDIIEFLREIFLSFLPQAKANNYTYNFITDVNECYVYFDPDKLEKVFYNLLSNAFKHTPSNGSISMLIKLVDGYIEIDIEDKGDGMEEDEMDKIFDHFYEIQGQKSYGQFKYGSGIGLAIVKNVVDLHKGKIQVKSKIGEGSNFIVSLLLGKSHLLELELIKEFNDTDISQYQVNTFLDTQIQPEFNTTNVEDDADRKCVLVVEDNPEVGEFIKNVLNDYYKVVLVENGLIGYQSALIKQPSLIISDMMMPEMDGMEFCSKIKSDVRTSHIPFILLSARTSLVYKYDGLGCGADDYLFKPFELKELLLKCKNIINTHDRLKEKFLNSSVFVPSELPVNSLDETMMNKAFQIVKDNISNEFFGVDQFCDELGVCRSLLFTKIKAWTNQTPNDFILNIRLKQAAAMIEQNRYNVADIGYKVGFKDPKYFSKIFKKHFNFTPKVYSEKFNSTN